MRFVTREGPLGRKWQINVVQLTGTNLIFTGRKNHRQPEIFTVFQPKKAYSFRPNHLNLQWREKGESYN